MNLLVKILLWIALIALVWIGLPFLFKTIVGAVGIVFMVFKVLVNLIALALVVIGIRFVWRRLRAAS
ncbi:MAG: hypothetical protein KatS3mg115_2622 [Candidatus Poribacteria bacterium]|nr:MAG: hypothetical protein KatS3mg115_2622 [Candidatus Poribacteria bacterium]